VTKDFVVANPEKTATDTVHFNKTIWFSNHLKLGHSCALMKCKSLGLDMLTLDNSMELFWFQNLYRAKSIWFEHFTQFGAHRPDQTKNDWVWSANGEPAKFLPQWGRDPRQQPDGKNGAEMCAAIRKLALKEYPPVELHDHSCSLPMKFFCAAKGEWREPLGGCQKRYC
jgi:hypothetical protein